MGNVQILLRQHVGAPCEAIVKSWGQGGKRYSHRYSDWTWGKHFFPVFTVW